MLFQRVITALVLAPVMLAGIFLLPPVPFAVFIGAIVVFAAWEWANLSGYERTPARIAVAAAMAAVLALIGWWITNTMVSWMTVALWSLLWWVAALALVVTYPASAAVIRRRPVRLLMAVPVLVPLWLGLNALKIRADSDWVLTWLMLLVWGADIGAYFAGRAFGRRKLAPSVSPGKTWAGVYGGMAAAVLISVAIAFWLLPPMTAVKWGVTLGLSLAVVAVSVLGDLLESLLKRFRGIKDSSQLLPGHGGILDRIDSLCAATPMFCLLLVAVAV